MLVNLTDLNICTESCSHRTWIGKQKKMAILHHTAEEINEVPDVQVPLGITMFHKTGLFYLLCWRLKISLRNHLPQNFEIFMSVLTRPVSVHE